PEGVIAAAAVKAIGGGMQGRRAPQKEYEREALNATLGDAIDKVLTLDDLVRSDDAFFAATGITDGPFLEGVHFDRAGGVTTHSIVIRALTGSLRYIKGVHQLKPEHIFGRMDTDGAVQIATR
ncbi:MAG: fructose-bisphosphatase class II, partial [Deltaproteobacteria bacterium]|nr:fructose-bisphosphatase class II [Deltaproteobacteria bacterium]